MTKEPVRLYTELLLKQVNKRNYRECGDQAEIVRTMEHTDFILADGIGSGSYANISARLCISRVLNLMGLGVSIHNACEKGAQANAPRALGTRALRRVQRRAHHEGRTAYLPVV